MSKLKVLHITPWFPNPNNKIEAIFIAEHLKALNNYCDNHVLHIQFGNKKNTETDTFETIKINRITLKPLFDKWIFKEKLAYKSIEKYLKANHQKYDVINFYITYPNAIHINTIAKQFPTVKFCMMEQWSAYHTQFNLSKNNKGRNRIENIFNNTIPLFTVSSALGKDIQNFIDNTNRSFEVIPNCINTDVFKYKTEVKSKEFIFASINNWSVMKNPIVLIKAFSMLQKSYNNVKLVLAGDGVLIKEMKQLVLDLKLESFVDFKGRISKTEVVDVLQQSNVYCQSSNYETFSAICIESLATGTPVIATKVGGMVDFINDTNGILVDDLEVESWFLALEKMYLNYDNYNKKQIAEDCKAKFNSKAVGELYYSKLMNVFNEK